MLAVGVWRFSHRHALRGLENELEQMLTEVEGKRHSRSRHDNAMPSAAAPNA